MNRTLRSLLTALAMTTAVAASPPNTQTLVYKNDFEAKPGTTFPEWTSSPITYEGGWLVTRSGVVDAPNVSTVDTPNHSRRILGEFGGPSVDRTARTRVKQTIKLDLAKLPKHAEATLSFDLLILRSWDGDSPRYGPDRLSVSVRQGATLLTETFSNNPKLETDKSFQSYPKPKSKPQTGALAKQSLGSTFFGDSTYHFDLTFPHQGETIGIDFESNLFEGKGTLDEAWGLDDVKLVVRPSRTVKRSSVPSR